MHENTDFISNNSNFHCYSRYANLSWNSSSTSLVSCWRKNALANPENLWCTRPPSLLKRLLLRLRCVPLGCPDFRNCKLHKKKYIHSKHNIWRYHDLKILTSEIFERILVRFSLRANMYFLVLFIVVQSRYLKIQYVV